jgi:hypothetical protein
MSAAEASRAVELRGVGDEAKTVVLDEGRATTVLVVDEGRAKTVDNLSTKKNVMISRAIEIKGKECGERLLTAFFVAASLKQTEE